MGVCGQCTVNARTREARRSMLVHWYLRDYFWASFAPSILSCLCRLKTEQNKTLSLSLCITFTHIRYTGLRGRDFDASFSLIRKPPYPRPPSLLLVLLPPPRSPPTPPPFPQPIWCSKTRPCHTYLKHKRITCGLARASNSPSTCPLASAHGAGNCRATAAKLRAEHVCPSFYVPCPQVARGT